jgi:hypothetical protein
MRQFAVLIAAGVVLGGAGCSGATASRDPGATASLPEAPTEAPAEASVASWKSPPQLARILDAASVRGDKSPIIWVPGTGYVTGAPDVLATIGQPLAGARGRNRTVEPCRETVLSEASKLGAIGVEAAPLGPEQKDPKGRIFSSVDMRITYKVPGGFELRRATLTCVVDRTGRIVDAYS